MDAAPKQRDTAKLVVAVGALALTAYLGYKYWYLPEKMRQDLARYVASTGRSPQDALAMLGAAGCQAYGAKYGIPPQGSADICGQLAQAASALVKQIPGLLNDTGMAVGNTLTYVGQGTSDFLSSVGQGGGEGIQALAHGTAGGAVELGMVPMKIVGGNASMVYGGVKSVVHDIGGAAKDVGHFFGSIF